MLNKFKNAFYNAVSGGVDAVPIAKDTDHKEDGITLSHKFPYTRPHFLQLIVDEEIQVSADKQIRPIIVPRDLSKLPWNSGYAEAVNAGKSVRNEDQACLRRAILQHPESKENVSLRSAMFQTSEANNPAMSLPYVYFSVFDGHAGAGAALAAANQLHHIIHEKLVDIIDHLLPPLDGIPAHQVESTTRRGLAMWFPEKEVSKEALIVGALECAFWEMDNLIAGDRKKFNIKGGCTALVALFILGKVYIANAGDSRAVMVKGQVASAMSNDFTPESERGRVRRLAAMQPHLLGGEFTHLDFKRRPLTKDLGKRVLYRDAHMMGWAYKTVTTEDLKIPVVHGEGKRSRVLATIGVTRGFGDHDLKALNCNIPIKPFLLSQPEVHIVDVSNEELVFADTDVLLMGTDGLWDVTTNDRAAEILQKSFDHFLSSKTLQLKHRYTTAAQDLVMQSRGKLHERSWRTSEGKQASTDDISVFVIPLAPYKEEYAAWKRDYDGIRGMYDNEKDTGKGFGKLSFRTSPVASEKMSPHFEPPTRRRSHDASSSDKSDVVYIEPDSVIVNGWEKKLTTEKKDLEWTLHPCSFSPCEQPTPKNTYSIAGKEIASGSPEVKSEFIDYNPVGIPTKREKKQMPSSCEFQIPPLSSSFQPEPVRPQHNAKSGGIVIARTKHNIGTSGTVAMQPESGVIVVAQTDHDVGNINSIDGKEITPDLLEELESDFIDCTPDEIIKKRGKTRMPSQLECDVATLSSSFHTMYVRPQHNAKSGVIVVAHTDIDVESSGTVGTQPEHDTVSDGREVLQTDKSQHPSTEPQPNVDASSTAKIDVDFPLNTKVTSTFGSPNKP